MGGKACANTWWGARLFLVNHDLPHHSHWDEPDASETMAQLRERVAFGNVSLVLHPGDVSA